MKKLLIILFVVISAVAAAATLNQAETPEVKSTNFEHQTVDAPNSNVLATWD